MKISHFPDFLPDETVFSVASRYLDRMQFHSHSTVSKYFFGGRKKGGVTDLPSNLEHLVQALPPHHMYTADAIIDHHTLFNLYAPFLPFERSLSLHQYMKSDGGYRVYTIAGIVGSRVPRPKWLRYCPVCVGHDRLTYGESYWHRIHQVPGVLVCPIHEVMLEDSSVNSLIWNNVANFRSAERSVSNLPERMVPAHLRTALVQLACNAMWLLERSGTIEEGYIQQQYLRRLASLGMISATGKVRQYAKLKKAVLDYYPAHLLEDVGCNITHSMNNWLANWTTMQHPLHHLLFIQFLCETSHEFFTNPQGFRTNPQGYSAPFGKGPWLCLNPLCTHYKEPVITSYTVKERHLNRPVATFTCICGFTYSRSGPDTDDDAMFHAGKILRYGDDWDQQLTILWLDQNISTRQVAGLMHSNAKTIRRQAARLGLPFAPDIPQRGKRPKIYQDSIKEQRDVYRAIWEEALKAHPNTGIKKVVKVARKVYDWLYKYDRDWLNEHWPTADLSPKKEQLLLSKIQQMRDSYSSVDADLAKVVRKTAKEIFARSDFPVLVTRQLLIAQIGNPAVFRRSDAAFNVLPLTSHALVEVIETSAAFIWRKLRWTVQSYLAEQVHPSYRAFLSRARIGYTTATRPIIKQLIQIAYSNLNAGALLNDQMPKVHLETKKVAFSRGENVEGKTYCSFENILFDKQLILRGVLAVYQTKKVYDLVPILLMTVAAIVNGAETFYAIENWGYQNQELLRWLGLPERQFPVYSALQKIYAKVDIDSFESVLGTWLREMFPSVENKTDEMKVHTGCKYVPGLSLLRPYRHLASEVVAKLR